MDKKEIREYQLKHYYKKRNSGICRWCDNKICENSTIFCNTCLIKNRQTWKKQKQKAWDIIFNYFGNKCQCCGESNKMFLTIDHIHNDGNRSEGSNRTLIISRRIKNGEDLTKELQLYCYNCNCGKHRNGGLCCPHVG